jgi:hypothetical protein
VAGTHVELSVFVGTRIICSCTFTNGETDVVADPTTVKADVVSPSGTGDVTYEYLIDPEIVRTGPGVYQLLHVLDERGLWFVVWRGEGAGGPICVDQIAVAAREAAS